MGCVVPSSPTRCEFAKWSSALTTWMSTRRTTNADSTARITARATTVRRRGPRVARVVMGLSVRSARRRARKPVGDRRGKVGGRRRVACFFGVVRRRGRSGDQRVLREQGVVHRTAAGRIHGGRGPRGGVRPEHGGVAETQVGRGPGDDYAERVGV